MTTLLDEIKALIADRGADHRRTLHGAGARPSRVRLLHESRPVRGDRRFHHRAGNLADVRRADRPLGGGSVVDHGLAKPGAAGRTRARPGHADERRAARGAHRAGVPRRARRLAHGDEPDAGGDAARSCCSTAACRSPGRRSLNEVPEGPAIVIGNEFLDALPVRQFVRVGGQWRERIVGLNDEGDLAFGVAATPEPYIGAAARTARCSKSTPPAIGSCSNSARGW